MDKSSTNWDLMLKHQRPLALQRAPASFSEVGKAGLAPGSERCRDKRTEEEAKGRAAPAQHCESIGTVKGVNRDAIWVL